MTTNTTLSLAERMMALFEGYTEAHGVYTPKAGYEAVQRGKIEIKSTARTVRDEVTVELWEKHLSGEKPLGIIPIRDNDTCLWGCIDVDTYGVDHAELVAELEKYDLPLVVCRSKSGGAHMFLFMEEPVPAGEMQDFLRGVSQLVGWGSSEVFPKQRSVQLERGDLGSWLNMPYFAGDETDRYAVGPDGRGLTLRQFLDLAERVQQPASFVDQTVEDFRDRAPDDVKEKTRKSHPDFGDGPPCMQHLSSVGYPEGTRNKGLYALAIFAKRKFGTQWSDVLERWNRDFMDPPLPSSEVVGIIRQVERKDYHYPCKDQPLLAHCNSALCRTRRYGVGGDDDFPVISGMSVLDTEPPLWFLNVEDARVELTTDDLQNYKSFHRLCMEQLFKCYRMMKQDQWLEIVGDQMRNAVRIEAPKEVGRTGQFEELLEAFLMDRHAGDNMQDLLMGRPYQDHQAGRVYFRLSDLTKHLANSDFRSLTRGQITTRIRRLGGDNHFFNVPVGGKGKGVNVFYIPMDRFTPVGRLDTPKTKEDVL